MAMSNAYRPVKVSTGGEQYIGLLHTVRGIGSNSASGSAVVEFPDGKVSAFSLKKDNVS